MAKRSQGEEIKLIRRMAKNRFVAGLQELLVDPDLRASGVREIVDAFVEIGSKDAWESLGEAVRTGLDGTRAEQVFEALSAHESLGGTRVADAALSHRDALVRWAVVRYLERRRSSHCLALLLRASRDPKPSVARLAARALFGAVREDPHVLSAVRGPTAEGIIELLDVAWANELLADEYAESIRIVAARRLGQLGGDDATAVLISLIESARGDLQEACWKSLEKSGDVESHHLIPLLAARNPDVRARALAVYARFCDPSACGLLAGLASDPEPKVRIQALSAIVRVLGDEAIEHLLSGSRDEDENVRLFATECLAKFPDLAPEMMEILEQNRGEVRRVAITYLANAGLATPDLVIAYMEFLLRGANVTDLADTGYLNGLAAAARALGQHQVPEALLALSALARSIVRRLRRIAMEAILLYEGPERNDALFSLIDTYDTDLLKHVAFGLHESGDERAFLPLIRAMMECKGRPAVRAKAILLEKDATSSLDALVPLLKERWASVRRFGAERLKILRDPSSIAPLLEASHDEDVEVQLAVFEALSPFAGSDQRVLDRMLHAIEYGDISIRQAACEALGEARCRAAVPGLIKALHNYFLRPRATEALKRIGDRKGYLALKRIERREKLFPKKPKEGIEMARRHKVKEAHK